MRTQIFFYPDRPVNTKFLLTNIVLIMLIISENALLFYLHKYYITSQSFNAKCYFLASVSIGLVLLYKFYKTDVADAFEHKRFTKKNLFSLGVLLAALIAGGVYYTKLLIGNPINYRVSDIIPFIQLFCKRLLHGQYVYAPVNTWGYKNVPVTYLPLQWLPFTVAEYFHFDPRYVSYLVWCGASIILFCRSAKATNNIIYQIMLAMLIPAIYALILMYNPGILTLTVELMVAAYYILLITGIDQKRILVLGLCISLCLLSRFSLILWLPLAAFTLVVSQRSRDLYKTTAIVLWCVILIYYLPFFSKDHSIFYKAYQYYGVATIGEWNQLDDRSYPLQLYQGCGFAYIFYYKLANIGIPERIKLLQVTHVALCLLVTVVLGIWYWFKHQHLHYKIFLMGSFKVYLSVFLAFIQIPYPYLMIVGNFVSVAIFCEQLRYRKMVASENDTKNRCQFPK